MTIYRKILIQQYISPDGRSLARSKSVVTMSTDSQDATNHIDEIIQTVNTQCSVTGCSASSSASCKTGSR